jgi:hypothetical protein
MQIPVIVKRIARPAILAVITTLIPLQESVRAAPLDPGKLHWNGLEMKTANSAGEVVLKVRLEKEADAAALQKVEVDGSPVLEPGDSAVLLLSVDISASFLLARKQWRGQTWALEENGAALQRVRFKPGRSGSYKRYRYAEAGVYRKRAEPKGRREARLPPERWSRTKHSYYPYAPAHRDCPMVSDPLALLYLIPAVGLHQGGRMELCVFNKHGIYQVTLQAVDTEPVKVGFPDPTSPSPEQGVREISGQRIRLTAQPLNPDNENLDPFEFIGLEGDIEFVFDPASGLPLLVRGLLPGAGASELRLTSADLVQ